jgi:hypothetical protein
MNAPLFDQNYTRPDEQAFRDKERIDSGTLGPYSRASTDPKAHLNKFVTDLNQQPSAKRLYDDAVFSKESALQAQAKLDGLTAVPDFIRSGEPTSQGDRNLVMSWYNDYLGGVKRGLTPADEMVSVNTIANIQSQQPSEGVGNTPYTAASRMNPPGGMKIS